ncbi:MAG: D-2-hydroxyacid dehydrogenase, partial [Planctomycetes bacterium]|nr:D-2-hydroxyacid dehydrogenase [Planctomycetota bacterium]
MKIVVLDGATANPGDLSWAGLESQGELTVYDRTPPEAVLERAAGAEVLLTNKTVLKKETLAALPKLRYIGVLATGTNVIDLAAANAQNIVVTNVPAYSTMSVAQQVFALLLELTNRVGRHDTAVHEGAWVRSEDFCFTRSPLIELDGLTLGIVGLGTIGRAVAGIGAAFGMTVIASSRSSRSIPGIAMVDRDTLFAEADVVSLHCPLTEETRGMINQTSLDLMKSTAFLINTGRGPLVDEPALAGALKDGVIAGAGLDVLSAEPPAAVNPLLNAPNCVITPHIAWATR